MYYIFFAQPKINNVSIMYNNISKAILMAKFVETSISPTAQSALIRGKNNRNIAVA